ncbi:MAG: DoxX family protein [Candidatus Omnitrophota bacterium]|nr:DoxX family protein [Candidatus Omnitrophota bacterium]
MEKTKFFNISMFLIRLVIGSIFIIHGSQKLFGMFNGIGLDGTSKLVEVLGFPEPYMFAEIWGCIEFLGGIFLLLGVMARWAAVAIASTVLIYMCKVDLAYSSLFQYSVVEYNAVIIGACVPVILMGGGSWSVWDI